MFLNTSNLSFPNSNEYFTHYGKICFISNKFEYSCKDIIRWLLSIKYVYEGKASLFSNEYDTYSEKLLSSLLGGLITQIAKEREYFNVSEDDIAVIEEGKNVRNWIAHELFLDWINENIITNMGCQGHFTTPDIKNKVTNLINADYLVSSWYAKFTNMHNVISKDSYIRNILNWVYDE